jgi:hypothetical protein
LYANAFSTLIKNAAGTITINIDIDGDIKSRSIRVNIAPLLHLRIKNHAITFEIQWVSTSFLTDTTQQKLLLKQQQLLESIFAAPKEPATCQTKWLKYFATCVESLFVDACVEPRWPEKCPQYTLSVLVVVKETSAEQWMTKNKIEDKVAKTWATESGYPEALLSITMFGIK